MEVERTVDGSGIRHIHLSGICGTAMGSLALLLKERGFVVTGSDEHAYPPMSTLLAERGIQVLEGFAAENLEPGPDLVVIGNALSRGNAEVEAALERKLRYISLAETLKEFFIRGSTSLVVTGTHGKTTTSALLAWVLESAGRKPGFMIGGVPENFGTGARLREGECFVSEGDEYDTAFFDKRSKFFHYLPDCVIVNNIEFDHADIFRSVEEIELAFSRMLRLVPGNGLIVANAADERVMRVTDERWSPRVTFAVEADADWVASGFTDTAEGARFTLTGPPGSVECMLPMHGRHNASNATAVAALCSHLGIALADIAEGLRTFRGVRRRLQRVEGSGEVLLYDDFAHHPTAIAETLQGVRAAHSGARVWALFEPRSNTTVKNVFQAELAGALGHADRVIVGKIHRLESIPEKERLDLALLLDDLVRSGIDAQQLSSRDEIVELLGSECRAGDVVVMMSNGAFDGLAARLPAALQNVGK